MNATISEEHRKEPGPESNAAIQSALSFFGAIFEPTDYVLLRPIETWEEGGKKRTGIDFNRTKTWKLNSIRARQLAAFDQHAEQNRLNQFFGVCPRFGGENQYDYAWQIRTVRCLWADIDHISVAEAQGRVTNSALPPPSILVNSGNGVHLYWILEQAYRIDDVDDPPAVFREWQENASGKKSSRPYIYRGEEKIYLDENKELTKLSPRALHVQSVLAGISKQVGGDHTTDLSRLLRIPGSPNRKNQRNGAIPVPTELVLCDPNVRYPISQFEPIAIATESSTPSIAMPAIPIPRVRKPTATKLDKLDHHFSRCAYAVQGQRSEADFSLCCFAVEKGIDREIVWEGVEHVGKFAEEGRRYFDVTWRNAEEKFRQTVIKEIQNPLANRATASPKSIHASAPLSNASNGNQRKVIAVDSGIMQLGDTLRLVTNHLIEKKECFFRSGQLVFIHKECIHSICSSDELAGLLSQSVEFYFPKGDSDGDYRPFPTSYGKVWLNNRDEVSLLPTIKIFARHPVYSLDWRCIQPGYDETSGIYCVGNVIPPASGTKHLDNLLADFCFRTPGDRTNLVGMMLTIVLSPHFVGSKPAVLLCANQAGLGKTILAQIQSILRDGQPAKTISYNVNDEEFEKRMGAVLRDGQSTFIIDNAKSRGKHPCIESACLERSITDAVLSFRILGTTSTVSAENSHTFCITANSPDVSRDIISRSVVVNLYHEGDPSHRSFSIPNPENYAQAHRDELLAELLGMVDRWIAEGMPLAQTHTRFNKANWGNIVGGILKVAGMADFLANADEVAEQLDETKRDFAELIRAMVEDPKAVFSASDMVSHCEDHNLLWSALGAGSARSKSTLMGTIASRYLNTRFRIDADRIASFSRKQGRNGNEYVVSVEEVAEPLDVCGTYAEPLTGIGSAEVSLVNH